MKNFFRKVAFGLKPEEKAPSDPLTWAQKQVESIPDRKSTRQNSSHGYISYAVFR